MGRGKKRPPSPRTPPRNESRKFERKDSPYPTPLPSKDGNGGCRSNGASRWHHNQNLRERAHGSSTSYAGAQAQLDYTASRGTSFQGNEGTPGKYISEFYESALRAACNERDKKRKRKGMKPRGKSKDDAICIDSDSDNDNDHSKKRGDTGTARPESVASSAEDLARNYYASDQARILNKPSTVGTQQMAESVPSSVAEATNKEKDKGIPSIDHSTAGAPPQEKRAPSERNSSFKTQEVVYIDYESEPEIIDVDDSDDDSDGNEIVDIVDSDDDENNKSELPLAQAQRTESLGVQSLQKKSRKNRRAAHASNQKVNESLSLPIANPPGPELSEETPRTGSATVVSLNACDSKQNGDEAERPAAASYAALGRTGRILNANQSGAQPIGGHRASKLVKDGINKPMSSNKGRKHHSGWELYNNRLSPPGSPQANRKKLPNVLRPSGFESHKPDTARDVEPAQRTNHKGKKLAKTSRRPPAAGKPKPPPPDTNEARSCAKRISSSCDQNDNLARAQSEKLSIGSDEAEFMGKPKPPHSKPSDINEARSCARRPSSSCNGYVNFGRAQPEELSTSSDEEEVVRWELPMRRKNSMSSGGDHDTKPPARKSSKSQSSRTRMTSVANDLSRLRMRSPSSDSISTSSDSIDDLSSESSSSHRSVSARMPAGEMTREVEGRDRRRAIRPDKVFVKQGSSPYSLKEFELLWGQAGLCRGETTEQLEKGPLVRPKNTTSTANEQYGRFLFKGMDRMCTKVLKMSQSSKYVDIGHGIGNTCLQVAYTIGCEARGIECMPGRHEASIDYRDVLAELASLHARRDGMSFKPGRVELKHGDFREYLDLIKDADVVFCNNYGDVFSGVRGGTNLDKNLAGVLGLLGEGAKLVTLHSIEGVLCSSLSHANKVRRARGLVASDNASFYEHQVYRLGKQNKLVSWSEGGGCDKVLLIHVYTRTKQTVGSGQTVFLCHNHACERARRNEPIPAVEYDLKGYAKISTCDCRVTEKAMRVRSRRTNYQE